MKTRWINALNVLEDRGHFKILFIFLRGLYKDIGNIQIF